MSDHEQDILRTAQKKARDVLATADRDVEAQSDDDAESGTVDILMRGQREAAALLLDGWMQVTEGRPPGDKR